MGEGNGWYTSVITALPAIIIVIIQSGQNILRSVHGPGAFLFRVQDMQCFGSPWPRLALEN